MTVSQETSRRLVGIQVPSSHLWQTFTTMAVMVMELSWVVPWYRMVTPITPTTTRWRLYLVLGGIYCVTFFIVRATFALRFKIRVRLAIMFILLLTGVMFGFKFLLPDSVRFTATAVSDLFLDPIAGVKDQLPALVLAVGASALAWRRGAKLAHQHLGPMSVMRSFRFGVLMFMIFSLQVARIGNPMPDLELFLFLFAGLIALGGGRFSDISYVRARKRVPFLWRVVLGVVIIAGSLVGLMLVLGIFARGSFLVSLRQLVLIILDGLSRLFFMVIKPVIYFIARAVDWLIAWLLPLFAGRAEPEQPSMLENFPGLVSELNEHISAPIWADEVGEVLNKILLWGGAVLAVVVLFYGMRRFSSSISMVGDDVGEALLNPRDLPRNLLAFLRKKAQETVSVVRALLPGERILAAMRIRRIYAKLLRLSAELGRSRPASSTPNEFLPHLYGLFPLLDEELMRITQAYVRVRYGELPENLEQIEAIEVAWRKVRARGKQLRKERKI